MESSSSTPKNSLTELEKLNDSIYIFHDPRQEKKVKALFIFFHDILWPGNEAYVQTWMSSGNPSICWPKVWLPNRYPEALILSARYNTSLWKTRNIGGINFDVIAESLWINVLGACRRNNCPILLIGHGMGGLLIKAIIRAMQRRRDELYNRRMACNTLDDNKEIHRLDEEIHTLDCFLKNVKGVLFYNTPCHGMRLEKLSYFNCLGPLWQPLEVWSTYTCNLNEYFRIWRDYRSCQAMAICGLRPATVRFNCRLVVVEEGSSRNDVDKFYPAIDSDHFSVCQPHDEKDSSFQILVDLFQPEMAAFDRVQAQGLTENTQSRREAMEIVESILSELRNFGEDGDGLQLSLHALEQIQEFDDIWSKLINGLKDAGFEKTGDNGNAEQWELD